MTTATPSDLCRQAVASSRRSAAYCVAALVPAIAVLCAPAAQARKTVYVRVKIEIKQKLTLERQAFDAEMKIHNTTDTESIDNVSVVVKVTDETLLRTLSNMLIGIERTGRSERFSSALLVASSITAAPTQRADVSVERSSRSAAPKRRTQ